MRDGRGGGIGEGGGEGEDEGGGEGEGMGVWVRVTQGEESGSGGAGRVHGTSAWRGGGRGRLIAVSMVGTVLMVEEAAQTMDVRRPVWWT